MLIVLSYLLVAFSVPVLLFGFFLLLGKPFWNIAVYLPWLLYSIAKNVFFLGPYRGFWQMIHKFMHNDSILGPSKQTHSKRPVEPQLHRPFFRYMYDICT